MASAEQDQWQEIAAAVRAGLAKLVVQMPAMTPGEVQQFVAALEAAQDVEIYASTFDDRLEAHRKHCERWALYGD